MKALLTINAKLSNVSIIGRIKEKDIEKKYDCLAYVTADVMPYLQNVHFDIRAIDTGLSGIEINELTI